MLIVLDQCLLVLSDAGGSLEEVVVGIVDAVNVSEVARVSNLEHLRVELAKDLLVLALVAKLDLLLVWHIVSHMLLLEAELVCLCEVVGLGFL